MVKFANESYFSLETIDIKLRVVYITIKEINSPLIIYKI